MFTLPIKILQTVKLETDQTTVTFSNIDSLVAIWDAVAHVTSRHLVLIINARSIDVSDSITNYLRFNGDDGNNYNFQRITGIDAVDSAGRTEGGDAIDLPPISGANSTGWGGSMVLIPYAFNTTNHKAVLAMGGAAEYVAEAVAARWASAAAITSVTVFEGAGDDFVADSTFHLGVIDERYLVEELTTIPIFDNIPQGEGDLAIIGYARSDRAAVEDEVVSIINDDDVAGTYPGQELTGRGAATGAALVNQECAMVSAANATANAFGALTIVWPQFAKGRWNPYMVSLSGYHETTGATAEVRLMNAGRSNSEPINKIELAPNAGTDFAAGSLFSLYLVPKRLIKRVELTAPQAVITFDNIPQYFEALQLTTYERSERAAPEELTYITFNDDAAVGNYDSQSLYGTGAAAVSIRNLNTRGWLVGPAANAPAGVFAQGILLLPGYSETGRKQAFSLSGKLDYAWLKSCIYKDTTPITKIELTPSTGPNFLAGSVFELEGILPKEGLPASEGARFG